MNKTKSIDEYIDLTSDDDNTDDTLKRGNIQAENSDSNEKEVGVEPTRDSKGKFLPGHSGNPGGRPRSSEQIISKFREDPRGIDVIQNLIDVASTFGTDHQHRDSVTAVKLVIERLVPALKSSDINITNDDKGFVFMPEQSKAKTEEDE